MTISKQTFSQKNAESNIFPYKVILLLVSYILHFGKVTRYIT